MVALKTIQRRALWQRRSTLNEDYVVAARSPPHRKALLMRKRIETAFSQLAAMFPRHIHAVSLRGFLMKVAGFVIAFALDKAFIQQLGLSRERVSDIISLSPGGAT